MEPEGVADRGVAVGAIEVVLVSEPADAAIVLLLLLLLPVEREVLVDV